LAVMYNQTHGYFLQEGKVGSQLVL